MWRGLSRGQGATVTDWFLEPTCPHSVRAFGKLGALLEAAGEDRLTVRITLHAQPWHLFSGVVSRAVLAATLLPDAGDAAWRVLAAVGAARDEFIATDHSHGPNMDLPLTAMLDRIDPALAEADIFAAIGTSGNVYPAAAYGQHARRMGAHTVELNLEVSTASRDFDEHRRGPASEVVPLWVDEVLNG